MTSKLSRAESDFPGRPIGRMKAAGLCVALTLALLAFTASSAFALAPWWHLTSGARPGYLKPGVNDEIFARVYNLGDAEANGEVSPIKIVDKLPKGLRAVAVAGALPHGSQQTAISTCSVESAEEAQCTYEGLLAPYYPIEVRVAVEVSKSAAVCEPGAADCEKNQVSVSGGEGRFCEKLEVNGSGKYKDSFCSEETGEESDYERRSTGPIAGASLQRPVTVNPAETPFGLEDFEMTDEAEGGASDNQAGSHEFQTTNSFLVSQEADENPPPSLEKYGKPKAAPAQLVRDLNFKLPPGWIGNPDAFPRCSIGDFLQVKVDAVSNECPADTAIGVAIVSLLEPARFGDVMSVDPVFNLDPRPGEPARFGFMVPETGTPVYIDSSVRTGGDYGVTVHVENITQLAALFSSDVTIWGVPGDSRHDSARGWGCLYESIGIREPDIPPCTPAGQQHPPALLSLPTSCTGPLLATAEGDDWAQPGNEVLLGQSTMPRLIGCNRLPFNPSIEVTPDGEAASSSTGMKVDVHVPQEETLNANGLAEADAKDITVALPPGVAVNPSGGDGLEACTGNPGDLAEGRLGSPGDEVGFTGSSELPSLPGTQTVQFTPRLPGSFGESEALEPGVNFCSNASKIGTVRIHTPILPNAIEGAVYLASQNANPFGSLIALYLVAEDPVSGVLIKVAGQVSLCKGAGEAIDGKTCEAPGQLITTFENSPQAPFEDAELEFFGGERAPLATPARCGSYTTTASISPWTSNAPVESSSTFQITSGPDHSACPGASLPFSPSLTGGATNLNAGLFSPLTGTFGREDGEQNVSGAQFHLPPGLSGLLSAVKLCGEEQANNGTCGPESLIGETTVSAGVGSDPVYVKGGRVYITGPYHGAPFGLSVVDPVKAGPFDLEHDTSNPNQDPACDCIVVRGRIEIDPITTGLTITTNSESEGYAIPHFIDGIPVQLKKINFITTRAGFQFNPTNCEPMKMTATIYSDEGASDNVQAPFQVTNCALLGFAPKLAISTSAKTSRTDGASLAVKLAYPSAPFGSQANIREVKVELPKGLPSRLSTLQKACTAAQFHADPAGCPAASIVGHARAITPVVPVPLEGPAYFVSNGGEAFPNLILVLQGYGITVDVVADTFISKAGVTSSTFKTVPDQPVDTFELDFPEGRYSALTADGNLCKQKLVMPTEFLAQNGAQLKTDTKIEVQGCGKAKKAQHKRKKAHRRKKNSGKKGKR